MDLRPAALLSLSFLLVWAHGRLTHEGSATLPIRLTVVNKLANTSPQAFSSSVLEGGILVSALRRLQEANQRFKFTVIDNPNFGLFLESVNGVAGSDKDKTYWELLSESSGEYTRLSVGVGCYQPAANEHIVFNFTTW
ncbi:transcobalamin beta a [Betta splendens]|uniref:Transcobalamin beta a n=1 Tax=Betta splendens TaxID=158456 RepID=A0A6P7PAB3_BETSP|nr:transcobalamin beta a [Betta splendens]